MRIGSLLRLGTFALLVVAGIGAAWTMWAWSALHRPYAGWEGPAVEVTIDPGTDAGTVLRRLAEAGVIERPGLTRAWIGWRGEAGRLHAGEYRFDRPLSAARVIERLARGDVLLHAVTFTEGLTRFEVAARLDEAGFGPESVFLPIFGDPSRIRDLDPDAIDLEGYLFPDTYHFRRGASPDEIADALVAGFRRAGGEAFLEEANRIGLGVRGAVTLASMIERETSVPEERERISQVFHNRLARGMRMECDPTVIYALQREGKPVRKLTYADLQFDSPWNTYVVHGLPAGPIANPGRDSLWAAVRPSEGDALYFVASPGGGHRFSEDLKGHLRAVADWRRHERSSR